MTAHERTGWRDQAISARHRTWGQSCPAVDLDFLLVEFGSGIPVALVEYKHHRARLPDLRHPTYRALRIVADAAVLPLLVAFYWPDVWAFRVHPVNDHARRFYGEGPVTLSERRFVASLYRMRQLAINEMVLRRLNDAMPPDELSAAA